MKAKRASVVITPEELKKVRGGFPEHVSTSNVIRKHLNLDPVAHGGKRIAKVKRIKRLAGR